MKKNHNYEAPEATVVTIESVDVITSSPIFNSDNVLTDGWISA